MQNFKSLLFRSIDIAPLVFFRIAFGIMGFIDVLSSWIYYHLNNDAYNPNKFQFPYIGFEWVQPIPEPYFSQIIFIVLLAAIGVTIGYRYRISALIFALGFTYLFLLEKSHYLNHGYLFSWIAFTMVFLPADRDISLRVWFRPAERYTKILYAHVFPFIFMMSVVYFLGGIAKINPDWLRAEPLRMWLSYRSDRAIIGPIVSHEYTAWFLSYGGLLFDLLIVFFLINRRTRIYAFGAVIGFHLINHLIFHIGIFPFLSTVLTLLYFPAAAHKAWWIRQFNRFPLGRKIASSWTARMSRSPIEAIPKGFFHLHPQATLLIFAALMLLHIGLPLRHHAYPGNVAWTEEGHRYSWRMKLRSKSGKGHFTLIDKATGMEEKIHPSDSLSRRQTRSLLTHPDMIWQYAQHLAHTRLKAGQSVEVHAHIQAKLNDYPYRTLIDPEVDLSAVQWHFFRHSPWIMPHEVDPR